MDVCAVIPVEGRVLSLEAADFIQQLLVERLAAKLLVVGYDFRFGRNRSGDLALLQALSGTSGYNVLEARPVLVQNEPVKSTWIRNCIREGNMPEAAELLGRAYSVEGCVVKGDQLGRQIGFPTANVQYAADKLLPASGVYSGLCWVDGSAWPAAINLGVRPTVKSGGGTALLLEAHLPSFSGDLYGKFVKIEFAERLREERRFGSLESLKEQILLDVEQVIASQPGKRRV
ncbi:MAG: riboflavin biosynthesis protein RibF [Armatimonadota bacterium]|nr:riboflavin biosynthesis protein RibF [Armatimonadota bacterium]